MTTITVYTKYRGAGKEDPLGVTHSIPPYPVLWLRIKARQEVECGVGQPGVRPEDCHRRSFHNMDTPIGDHTITCKKDVSLCFCSRTRARAHAYTHADKDREDALSRGLEHS